MRGLVPYAWRSLVARPARTLLTVFGIAIGVAVLVAALAVNAGLDASIDRTVASLAGRADLRVAAFTEAGLSGETLAAVDGVPGVALTAPAIERRSFLAPRTGRPAVSDPVTVLGIDPDREPRVRDLVLVRGTALADPGEAAALVPERLAAAEGLDVGSELGILGAGAPVRVTVVGILAGDGPALGSSGRTVVLPIAVAAALVSPDEASPGAETPLAGITRIDVVLAAGADAASVTAGLEGALTAEPYVLSVPRDVAATLRASSADVRAMMALLAAITLFAAAFLILNTLAMTVAERIRELGLLRAAGAGRGQVVRVVVTQAVVLGTAGSVLGLMLGGLLAGFMATWLRASGSVEIDAPVLAPGVLVAGFLGGLGATIVAALEPARRAAGVSPVAALRSRADPTVAVRARTRWLIAVVGVVGVLAVVLLPGASATPSAVTRTAAVYVVLLAAVLLTPVLLGPLGRVAGFPFALALRLEERLARAAIARDPGRTTLTVGALVVGLAMVVALGAVAVNSRVAATAWLADVVPGDEILTAIAPAPVGEGGVDEELAAIDGVRRASPIATFDLAFRGTRLEAVAIRGADLEADGRLSFTAGDRAVALAAVDAGGAVIVPRSRAQRLGVGLGDVLAVATADGLLELQVAGVVERSFPGRTGEAVLVGWGDALDRLGVGGADAIAIRYEPVAGSGARDDVHAFAAERALTVAPISSVEGAVGDALDRVFGLLDLLALAAVVIAALGIVNTLSMDTWERVRELGMLRAVGMSRRQVWRSVLVEAGILGAIGGVVGSVAGIGIGVLLVATAGGRLEAGIRLPWPSIAFAIVLAVALAMLAAAQPARIAGSRSIVSAVRGE
jgi:putative ABC transport system permease protein